MSMIDHDWIFTQNKKTWEPGPKSPDRSWEGSRPSLDPWSITRRITTWPIMDLVIDYSLPKIVILGPYGPWPDLWPITGVFLIKNVIYFHTWNVSKFEPCLTNLRLTNVARFNIFTNPIRGHLFYLGNDFKHSWEFCFCQKWVLNQEKTSFFTNLSFKIQNLPEISLIFSFTLLSY